ncbi:MAG: hypothetical protein KJ063_25715 [Anaerolineae bacterium]|nr:hypothetical protein [Anaerolineae bacterium]
MRLGLTVLFGQAMDVVYGRFVFCRYMISSHLSLIIKSQIYQPHHDLPYFCTDFTQAATLLAISAKACVACCATLSFPLAIAVNATNVRQKIRAAKFRSIITSAKFRIAFDALHA